MMRAGKKRCSVKRVSDLEDNKYDKKLERKNCNIHAFGGK
jgi:hypothetical protein